MIAYCPHCWTELTSAVTICPRCGADLTADARSYADKIMGALQHPLPEARARACWLLGVNTIEEAAPSLMDVARRDDDLFVRLAAVEALGHLHAAAIPAYLQQLKNGSERRMANQAAESLVHLFGHAAP